MKAAAMPCYDDADKKLMALFREISIREQSYVERAYDAVFAAGLRPAAHTAPLHFAQLNFCRPTQVASRWMTESSREAKEARDLLAAMKASPDAAGLVQAVRLCEDVVALREESGRPCREALRRGEARSPLARCRRPEAAAGAPAAKATASMPPPPGPRRCRSPRAPRCPRRPVRPPCQSPRGRDASASFRGSGDAEAPERPGRHAEAAGDAAASKS
jgi:hypothetical protein